MISNLFENLKAAHFGEFEIQQDQIWNVTTMGLAVKHVQSLRTIAGDPDDVRNIAHPHGAQRQLFVIRIVFNKEDRLGFYCHDVFREN